MDIDLLETARTQGGVVTRAQAIAAVGRPVVDAAVAGGQLVAVRGVYTFAAHRAGLDADGRHLLDCAGRVLRSRRAAFVSHGSAALAYGIPLLERPDTSHITVDTPGSATSGGVTGRHLAEVPDAHRALLRGLRLTTAARSVADLCRDAEPLAALVALEGALHLGLDKQDVAAVLADCRRWPGVVAARGLLALASCWSESPLETLGMHWCRQQGLPAPQQQLTVRTLDGRFVARVDQLWEDQATVGELDGQGKYAGSDGRRVLWEEKRREDRLLDVGLQVVRGYWSDRDDDGAEYADRARRAFARSASSGARHFVVVDERERRSWPLAA
ncbi:MAG: hypothetical protein JWN77_2138 [Frankiales bacterium]|jgi:hypothetical protein|nr:hypothetical protein [Frankiales bacterium]